MSLKTFKFLLLSSLGLSLFVGNAAAFAQMSTSEDVVVPTTGSGTTTSPGTSIPVRTGSGTVSTPVNSNTRFSCQLINGQYTVMYQPQSQPGQFFPWAAPRTLGSGWNSQKRCATIAERLESYRPDGLQELKTAVENRQNIVCVTTEANGFCRIVLTVPPERDPNEVLNGVFQNLADADDGRQTVAVNTYRNRGGELDELTRAGEQLLGIRRPNNNTNATRKASGGINLKPFLDKADGGTGSKLRNGIALRTRQTGNTNNTRNTGVRRLNTGRLR